MFESGWAEVELVVPFISQVGRPRLLWGAAAGLGVLSVLLGLGLLAFRLFGSPPVDQFEQVAADLKGGDLGPGAHPGLDLPGRFRSLTPDGKVDAFRTGDGRLLVLFKTSVGWKGNYSGFVYADGGLRASDLGSDYYGRTTVRMGFPDAAAPVLGKRWTDRCYQVFFDLG